MIDRDFIDQLAEDIGPEGVRAVSDVFAKDLARLVLLLEQSAAAADAAAFHRAAHGLAGAAGAIGAAELERACRTAMARSGQDAAALAALQAQIAAAGERAEAALFGLLAAQE